MGNVWVLIAAEAIALFPMILLTGGVLEYQKACTRLLRDLQAQEQSALDSIIIEVLAAHS
jgi:hypothetical protein